MMRVVFFFCFKQKTAYEMRISDWSSDVCSSDLPQLRTAKIAQKSGGGDEAREQTSHGAALAVIQQQQSEIEQLQGIVCSTCIVDEMVLMIVTSFTDRTRVV